MRRTKALAGTLLAASVVLGTATAASADILTINIPAPVSQAEGLAANVAGIIGIGHTQSEATPTTGDAVANAVEIGGKAPLAVLGSSQSGPGTTSNALLDTQQTPLGRIEAAPSTATVTQTDAVRQADSNAALGRGNLFSPDFASISILESTSTATHQGLLSKAFSTSDALVLNLGGPDGTTLRLLHSESSSAGTGLTYILAINDTPIISVTELTDQICSLSLPEVLRVSCLQVTGGVGQVTSQVLGATVGGVNGLNVNALSTSGSGGSGAVQTASAPAPAEVQGSTFTAPVAAETLPTTGMTVFFMASFAVALMALGWVLVGMRKVTAH